MDRSRSKSKHNQKHKNQNKHKLKPFSILLPCLDVRSRRQLLAAGFILMEEKSMFNLPALFKENLVDPSRPEMFVCSDNMLRTKHINLHLLDPYSTDHYHYLLVN